MSAVLVILGGLPGSGKTTIARVLATRIGAMHVRIDTIEQALRESGRLTAVEDAGYRAGYALAADNLRLGHVVIADSVNPVAITRQAWRGVAAAVSVPALEVQLVCTDPGEHRRRVETRTTDIAGLVQPDWAAVTGREYEPWREALTLDTAVLPVESAVDRIVSALPPRAAGRAPLSAPSR